MERNAVEMERKCETVGLSFQRNGTLHNDCDFSSNRKMDKESNHKFSLRTYPDSYDAY